MTFLQKIKKNFFTIRYLKFFITGLTAFAVDITIFRIGIKAGLSTLLANTISVGVSIIVNYIINRFWVFESKEKRLSSEFGKFFLVQGINYLMNTGFLLLFVALGVNKFFFKITDFVSPSLTNLFSFFSGDEGNKLFAKVVATSIQLITSFLLYKFLVFKTKEN